jgi:hypothetical protein
MSENKVHRTKGKFDQGRQLAQAAVSHRGARPRSLASRRIALGSRVS